METERGDDNHQQGVLHRMLPAVLPVLLISVGYVDPGKWVATVEGGARFGFDLVVPMLLFNCAAILCQYLSARIGVVTGRDLAQICSDEYKKSTRIFLGVQAELSVVVLDLTMVLGVAHGINLLFGMDLSTGVFLAALDALLFPVFATFLDHRRASFLCIYAASFILLSYVFEVLLNQPEISISMTGIPTKLSGESAFALMSLLGASIMPHNFYLHSSIVQLSSGTGTGSLWSRQPFEQFGVAEKSCTAGNEAFGSGLNSVTLDTASGVDLESKLLLSFRHCIVRLLKLDGSDWLFRQNDGADEDLIDRVAARESFLYDAEAREMNHIVQAREPQHLPSENRYGSTPKNDEAKFANFSISSVPHCGEGCIWKADLIISFGVWCIHRILDLSLMESRPELWGKYTFVLNQLQGVIDLAFSKPRNPMLPCLCLQIPQEYQQRFSPPVSNGMLPPAAKPGNGKCTNAAMLLDIIKDVETAISCRKGRKGTASGDIASPKEKENLKSVLKRYKRRLSNKLSGTLEGSGSRNVPTSAPM